MGLKSIAVIESSDRISSVDVFRAMAILPVVMYHFENWLPFGYLGVDLFFVISGLLVGGILIRKYKRNNKIQFFQFILQRGFKIWPSYYWFLLFGTVIAWLIFRNDHPEYYVNANVRDVSRYVFFYQNYTGGPFHWPFDHVWSLCVEEHFYILLPIVLIIVKAIMGNKRQMLFLAITGLIVGGFILKVLGYYLTNSRDTYSGTHTRIDALGWGVLLGALVSYYEEAIRRIKKSYLFFVAGLILFALGVFVRVYFQFEFFNKIIFNSLAPFCFFLMLLGVYYHDFSKWKIIRFVAYYSYNWYLWHPISFLIVQKYFGISIGSFFIYMSLSFLAAFLFTILIEEKFLMLRERVMKKHMPGLTPHVA
jgi:peptidoglycan/LPS O-acetylase OafA/YrhL